MTHNTDEQLITTLKELRKFKPRADYRADSLRTIVATEQVGSISLAKRVWESVVLGAALALASLLLLVVLGGFPAGTSQVAEGPDFDIQISEAQYHQAEEDRKEVAFRLERLEDGIRSLNGEAHIDLLEEVSALREALSQ